MGHDGPTLIALAAALSLSTAAAQPVLPVGEKSLVAVTRDGNRTPIGTVVFTALDGGQSAFRVQMDHTVMRDHFLSMREFKCLPAAVVRRPPRLHSRRSRKDKPKPGVPIGKPAVGTEFDRNAPAVASSILTRFLLRQERQD